MSSNHQDLQFICRLHVLPLSDEASEALFSNKNKNDIKDTSVKQDQNNKSQVLHYFMSRLILEKSFVIELYQICTVSEKYFVVIDIEAESQVKIMYGLFTENTIIYTDGASIKPLVYIRLSLLRPFSFSNAYIEAFQRRLEKKDETESPSSSYLKHSLTSAFKKFVSKTTSHVFKRNCDDQSKTLNNSTLSKKNKCKNQKNDKNIDVTNKKNSFNKKNNNIMNDNDGVFKQDNTSQDTVVSEGVSEDTIAKGIKDRLENNYFSQANSKTKDDIKVSQPDESDEDYPNTCVDLKKVLQSALLRFPCAVFITCQEIKLPCPKDVHTILMENKKLQNWNCLNRTMTMLVSRNFLYFPKKSSTNSLSHSNNEGTIEQTKSSCIQIKKNCSQVKIVSNNNQTIASDENDSETKLTSSCLRFFVTSTGNQEYGLILNNFTNVEIELDILGEFSRVQISPIQDTLPEIYNIRLYEEYIRPLFLLHASAYHKSNQRLEFQGIQFKIIKTLPAFKDDVDIPDRFCVYWKPFRGVYQRHRLNNDTRRNTEETNISYYNKSSDTHDISIDDNDIKQNIIKNNSSSSSSDLQHIDISCCEKMTAELIQEWKQQRNDYLNKYVADKYNRLSCRIGLETRIHEGEPIKLHWTDVLSPEVVEYICSLPARSQPFAAMTAVSMLSPDDLQRAFRPIFVPSIRDFIPSTDQHMRDFIINKYSTRYKPSDQPVSDLNLPSDLEAQGCSVCLEEFQLESIVIHLPCSHLYHKQCLDSWLKVSLVCPLCKYDFQF